MMSYKKALSMSLTPRFPHLEQAELRECDAVALSSFEHLGKKYKITRELQKNTIDCSTVVSQSHWIGAAVQLPFIAETQRRAVNARTVERADMLPGDSIYAYAKKEDSPGGRHNHVVLFIGNDDGGTPWAMESREESGAVLTELSSVSFAGGIRRFCIEPLRIFAEGPWSRIVRQVPKLGRLGARLTVGYRGGGRHTGLDIYWPPGSAVISPLAGSVVDVHMTMHGRSMIGIWSARDSMYSVVGPISVAPGISAGLDVRLGDLLGAPMGGVSATGCNAIPQFSWRERLHWELWASRSYGASPAPDLICETFPSGIGLREDLVAQNALYFVKQGRLGVCLGNA
jgi:hypothetical protein